ncbi:MAG TPA: dihydrofolate reductase family protein [Methanomassiliicoccales archaeon]|jgi:dihydrofolate reductase|nr:dihydrofolate reductase family protein [Methanomassiliicoccales archaeon]
MATRKVVLYAAMSLDGYIARRNGSYDWLPNESDKDYGFAAFFRTVDALVMGRVTYDQVSEMSPFPYEGKECYVFSRKRKGRDEHAIFVNKEPTEFVAELRKKKGLDIWLVGGSEIADAFFKAGLVDEYVLGIAPVILGDGIPMFRGRNPEVRLHLNDSQTYLPSGLASLRYTVRK